MVLFGSLSEHAKLVLASHTCVHAWPLSCLNNDAAPDLQTPVFSHSVALAKHTDGAW